MGKALAGHVLILTLAMLSSEPTAAVPRTARDWIRWESLPPLPNDLGVSGAYVGVSNGTLLVAGGTNFPMSLWEGGQRTYHDAIYALEPGAQRWRSVGVLPQAAGYGAAVSHGQRLVCIGGRDVDEPFATVLSLRYDPATRAVEVESLPPLPQACYELAAVVLGDTLHAIAGRDDSGPLHRHWSIALPTFRQESSVAWKELPPYPTPARYGATLIAQSDGDGPSLYLVGGKSGDEYLRRVDRFKPSAANSPSVWTRRADLPRPAYLPTGIAWGQSHLFLFGGSTGENLEQLEELKERYRFPREDLAYHTITDTWVHVADAPAGLVATAAVPWNGGIAIPGGEISPGLRTAETWWGHVQPVARHFGPWDYLAVALYLSAIALIGLYCAQSNRSTDDFFLGGRRIPWWAAGLSLLATQVSSIGVMAIPAKSYATNWVYMAGVAAWFVVVPIVTNLFIPFFRRLNVTSAYEYLEARFSRTLRMFGSLTYCLLQMGRLAVVLYLPALALASVTGIDVIAAVLVMGLLCTIYTVAGGMQAVIWTDVAQACVLVGGMLLCLGSVMWQLEGGPSQFWQIAESEQKFQTIERGWDAFHATLWVVLVGNVFTRLANLTSDQAVVQRYLTTRDESQSRKALWADVIVSIPWALLVFSLGTALFVFYRVNPQLLNPEVNTDGIVPFFVAQQLPTGISGIVVAAIIAAAMSSMDSSLHSIATLMVTDVYGRLRPAATEHARFRAARYVTVVIGIFGTASAVVLALADVQSLWDWFQYVMGLFVGSLGGLFLLGVFSTRTNSTGALVGALVSAIVLAWVTSATSIHFFLFSAIGMVTCFAVGWLASFVLPGRRQIAGLTAFTLEKGLPSGGRSSV